MSEKLNTIVGKQNDFATRLMGGGAVVSGAGAGTKLTLTPPSGQRVRLTHLSTATGVFLGDVSVIFGSTTVYTGNIFGSTPDGGASVLFSVGSYQPYVGASPPAGNYEWWTGEVDEVFTLVKNGIDPSQTFYYGYQFGE